MLDFPVIDAKYSTFTNCSPPRVEFLFPRFKIRPLQQVPQTLQVAQETPFADAVKHVLSARLRNTNVTVEFHTG